MKRTYALPLVLAVLVVGGLIAWGAARRTTPVVSLDLVDTQSRPAPQTPKEAEIEYAYIEVARTGTRSFICRVRPNTESSCALFAADTEGKNLQDLRIFVDVGPFNKKIVLSPDKEDLMIVLEQEVRVIDTVALSQRIVSEAPEGDAFGVYDDFPMFIPHVRWLNDGQIEALVFKRYTREPRDGDPDPVPLETRTISVE